MPAAEAGRVGLPAGEAGRVCPHCDSDDVELVAPWGGQIITAQYRCNACATYFEAIRADFDDT